MPVVYEELRRLAHHYMRRERPGQTLQTTALVNEACIRLADYRKMGWQGRAHFFAVAAQVMRRILVERPANTTLPNEAAIPSRCLWTKRQPSPGSESKK
jgi:hypothetical protein